MYDYYCKNCEHIVRKWDNEYKYYKSIEYCNYTQSKNFNSIYFLDCENCNNFIGLSCENNCVNCFGRDKIFKEKKLFNWFLKYKKSLNKIKYLCNICNNIKYFGIQDWFFEELTFYKK